MKINGRYGILNVDLTCSFCCDFEFSCLVLQRDEVWYMITNKIKANKIKITFSYHTQHSAH